MGGVPLGGGGGGLGCYHGKFGFDTFSHQQSVMRKGFLLDLFSAYPPYGSALKRIRPFLEGRF